MTSPNERNNHNEESKKSELLPKGGKADEIVKVLVAMFRASQNSEDVAKGDDSSEHVNRRRDAGEKE